MGIMLFILHLICVFYMFTYALSPKRSKWGRIIAFIVIVVSFLVPYGYCLAFAWGAVCWADARAGNQ